MDDKTRFDQLEEIIVEMLHKLDRTIEDVGRLREAVAAQQLLLVHLQNEISRTENEVAAVRRIATETARVLNKSVAELVVANHRNERLLQDTSVILAESRMFQEETRRSFVEIRYELAENKVFRQETKQSLAENKAFQDETKQSLAENKAFQDETKQALAENKAFQQETKQALAENKAFQDETKQALAENKAFQDETKQALAENKAFQDETRQALAATNTTLAKILDLLTKP